MSRQSDNRRPHRPAPALSVPQGATLLDVDVVVECRAWDGIAGLEAATEEAARSAFHAADGAPTGRCGLTVALLDDAAVCDLNRQFRGQDKPTNVLSFPAAPQPAGDAPDPSPVNLGDIALAYETVAREAGEGGIALLDHVRHLVVHGALHLLGYDHETDAEAERMETLETRVLAGLGVADPYAR